MNQELEVLVNKVINVEEIAREQFRPKKLQSKDKFRLTELASDVI